MTLTVPSKAAARLWWFAASSLSGESSILNTNFNHNSRINVKRKVRKARTDVKYGSWIHAGSRIYAFYVITKYLRKAHKYE